VERNSENQIAVVYAEGNIVDGQGGVGSGWRSLCQNIPQAATGWDVKTVVLRVNSPGGSATTSEVIQRVRLTGQVKPVVVSMGNVAASGGYWIVTDADFR